MNGAYQELMLWNGQFGGIGDNLGTEDMWTEGTPLESNFLGMHGLETQAHGGLMAHRMLDIGSSRVAEIQKYKVMFKVAFPSEPDPIHRLNTALAIAAYERTLLANQAPFQKWLRGKKNAMTKREKHGAILFFGKAGCADCHTGPALNSMTFYALGMKDLDGAHDMARVNLAPFGLTVPDGTRLGRGGFTGRPQDEYTFKTPQLYNLMDSPFYGHGASFATVREVVEYINNAAPENPIVPASQLAAEFQPLGLTSEEIGDIVAFIENALYDANLERYLPNALPSGNCFPVNDPQSQEDLGCEPSSEGQVASRE
jgi:cytochrome c peroxidase